MSAHIAWLGSVPNAAGAAIAVADHTVFVLDARASVLWTLWSDNLTQHNASSVPTR